MYIEQTVHFKATDKFMVYKPRAGCTITSVILHPDIVHSVLKMSSEKEF